MYNRAVSNSSQLGVGYVHNLHSYIEHFVQRINISSYYIIYRRYKLVLSILSWKLRGRFVHIQLKCPIIYAEIVLSVPHAAFNQTPPYILKYKFTSSTEHECQICKLFSLAHDVVSHNIPVRDFCRYVYFCDTSVHRQVHSVQ